MGFGVVLWFVAVFGASFVLPLYGQEAEVRKLEKYLTDKCFKRTGTTATFDKLRNDTYDVYKYFEDAFFRLPAQKHNFCTNVRPTLIERFQDVSNDLKPCLNPEEEYLPEFAKGSFTEFLNFFCYNDGEYTERFFGKECNECIRNVELSKTNGLEKCMDTLFNPAREISTKKEMCEDIAVTRTCYKQLFVLYCRGLYNSQKLNDIFFDYVSKPCSSCIHSASTIVLLGSLLVHNVFKKF